MFCLTPFAASPQSTRSISSAWELVFAQFRKQRLAVAFDALWAHSINLREFAHGPRLASCNLQQRRVLQDAVCGPSILPPATSLADATLARVACSSAGRGAARVTSFSQKGARAAEGRTDGV